MTSMKLTAEEQKQLAERLYAAAKAGQGVDPPSETINYTFDDAYRVRRILVDKLIADGGVPKGHKIGFTAKAMQEMYGMSGPDFGQLMDNMFVPYGEPVAIGHLSDTRVEPELAFEMAGPMEGPGITLADVLKNTARIWTSIELIDSRVGATRADAVDSIADNACAGKVVLGPQSFSVDEYDFGNIDVSLTVDGETLTGNSSEVMGHPGEPVAWLANRLAEINGLGGRIEAGDIVMSGSCTRSMIVKPGSKLHADFGPLGEIAIDFV